jgi:uncharacterized protein (DUF1778 family)
MTANALEKAAEVDASGVLIRLNAEETMQLAEALLNPARGPNPRLIAAAKRYLAFFESQ